VWPTSKFTNGLVRRHVGAPMYMRGPGAVPGLYALEAGMNELAEQFEHRSASASSYHDAGERTRALIRLFPRVI